MKCQSCRDKDAELLTWWEKTRNWLFLRVNHVLFPQDFEDFRSEKYTQGFGDGLSRGVEQEKHSHERMKELYSTPAVSLNVEELVEQRLIELFSPVDPALIATFNEKTKQYYIGGNAVDAARLQSLKAEAETITQLDVWKIIHESVKELAQRAMFVEGDNLDTMKKGRSILYMLDTQDKILKKFSTYQQPKP